MLIEISGNILQCFIGVHKVTHVFCVLQMFRKLHNAYVDMLCNPFYIPGEQITSK